MLVHSMAWPISINTLRQASRWQPLLLAATVASGFTMLGLNLYSDWTGSINDDLLSQPSSPQPIRTAPTSIHTLIDAQLFGQAQSVNKQPPAAAVHAPETRLRLELKGAFSHTLAEQSRALIAEKGKSAKYYRVGDVLPGGAALDQVAAEHVVLNRNGSLETLSFNPNKRSKNVQDMKSTQFSSAEPSYTKITNASDLATRSIKPSTDDQMATSQSNVESIKDRLKRLRAARDL